MIDMVNHPPHYTSHPAFGVECHDIAKALSFDAGNATKYLWRVFAKGEPSENLRKALWYLGRAESPVRIEARWDTSLEALVRREAYRYIETHAYVAPVQSYAVMAVERIVSADMAGAHSLADTALRKLNEGATA